MGSFLRSLLAGSSLAVVVLTLTGCVAAEETEAVEDTESAFAVLPPSWSMLLDLELSRGRPDVCVGMLGFAPEERVQAAERIKANVTSVANRWNKLLESDPNWSIKWRIEPVFRTQPSPCAAGRGFAVNVWKDHARFNAERCAPKRVTPCRNHSEPWNKAILIGPALPGCGTTDIFNERTMLHEYGHLLGMGDTYRVRGKSDWDVSKAQPPSVMNGQSTTLTNDDELGLRFALQRIKTDRTSCDGFGSHLPMTSNDWRMIMCTDDAKPVPIIDHSRYAQTRCQPAR